MLLSYDMDVWLKHVKSIRSYSRIWGCTERTAKAVIQAYQEHSDELYAEQHLGQHGEQHGEQHGQHHEEQQETLETPLTCEEQDSADSSTESSTESSTNDSTDAALLRTEPDPDPQPERTDAAVASPTAKREVKRETDPWLGTEYRLTQAQLDRLRTIRIRGFERSEADVIAWFMVKAPIMVAKGYKSLPRTALNWWPRATPEEIAEAVRAYDNRTYARHCELNPLPPYDEEAEKAKIATMLAETGWGRVVQ